MSEEYGILNAINDEYSELTGILLGEKHRVDVIVEDEFDVPFWNDLLQSVNSEISFHISPYQYGINGIDSHEKGKSHILRMAKNGQLGCHLIGCVDSDYDYLLQNKSEYWDSLESPRILQTYTYSIENLMCYPQTLRQVCCNSFLETIEYDFVSLFYEISRIIYPLLKWAMYMMELESKEFTQTSWGNIFSSTYTHGQSYSVEGLTIEIEGKVNTIIKNLEEKYPNSEKELERCEQEYLTINDIEEKSCFLFVRGHDLYDFILNRLLKPIFESSRRNHINQLKSSNPNPINAINHYKNSTVDISQVIARNYLYKNYSIYYEKIKSDAIKALAK